MRIACRRMPVTEVVASRAHSYHMLQVACRFAAYCMLHASHCLLLVTCCMLYAVCFNSKCCNRGWNAIYVSGFLYPASVACRMLQVACCVLQAASRLVYFRVQQYWTTRYIPLPAPCFWLLTLWLLAAYSLPMLLVACYPPLAARCLPDSAALGGDLPQSAQG